MFSKSCRTSMISSTGMLTATCQRMDGSWMESSLPLNAFIGNEDGKFRWGGSGWANSVNGDPWIESGSILTARLWAIRGIPQLSSINLDEYIENRDGVLKVVNIPVLAKTDQEGEKTFLKELEKALAGKDAHLHYGDTPDGFHYFYISHDATARTKHKIFRTYSVETTRSIFNLAYSMGNSKILTFQADVCSAHAKADIDRLGGVIGIGTYAGWEMGLDLAKIQVGPLGGNLGVAVDTDIGYKVNDDSFEFEIAGTGFETGRKVGIFIGGSSITWDWGVLFGS